ncbi:hypothetical protein E4T56_gene16817 [Termitomyces sp. T112]|nr:hypothetical protein E4T56_gene16817 [Termitomyces sp. T112]
MQLPVGVAPSTCSKSGIHPGVVRLVPEGSRVVQVEVMPEQFAKVVGWARGPPTLEWCQVAAPCEFEEPALGRCSITLSWHAACIAAEQGWDQDWVAAQLEEGRKGRVSGRGSGAGGGEWVSMPAMKMGPPRGERREGAPSTQEKGKQRVSPSPKVGPSKRAQGEQVMGGPPGSVVYSPTSRAPIEQSAGRLWSVAEAYLWRRVEALEWLLVARKKEVQGDKDVTVGTAVEQLSRLQELEVWTVHLQAQVQVAEVAMQQTGGSGARETQQGSSAGEVQAAAERVWWQEEWLANEVASGWRGVLHEWFPHFLSPKLSTDSISIDWAREHHILLDGASAALGSIHDGLVRMPGDLLPELGQGVTQMGRLLAGHWWRAIADPGAWWEMATDMGEPLPGQPEVLAIVVAQLEVFMVGRVAGFGSEGEGE